MSLDLVVEWDTFVDSGDELADVDPGVVSTIQRLAQESAEAEQARAQRAEEAAREHVRKRQGKDELPGSPLRAGAPLSVLMHSLARAGWGPLEGRQFASARAILTAIALAAKRYGMDKSGQAVLTRHQLAKQAGVSTKTIQRWMPVLEAEKLIYWVRGMVLNGQPVPGYMKVNKRRLMALIRLARAVDGTREMRRRKEVRRRLERFKNVRLYNHGPNLEEQGDTMTLFTSSFRRVGGGPQKARRSQSLKKDNSAQTTPQKEIEAMPSPLDPYLQKLCTHDTPHQDPTRCNRCRYEAMLRRNEHENQQRREKREAERRDKERSDAFIAYMKATYPDQPQSRWPRLTLNDPRAQELARG